MNFTYQDVVREVRQLAEEHPNATYERVEVASGDLYCFYSQGAAGGGEGCIVGQALARLGYDVEKLDDTDSVQKAQNIMHSLFGGEYGAYDWIQQVQRAQDCGETWSSAVGLADAVYGVEA